MTENIGTYFHPLTATSPKPERFTYPFRYEPHPMAIAAAQELMQYIEQAPEVAAEAAQGKMFGVLAVEDSSGQSGFLAAYSGLLCGRNDLPYFVPAVYDMLHPDGHFKVGEREISAINARVAELESSLERNALCQELAQAKGLSEREIAEFRAQMEEAKRRRDDLRSSGFGDNLELAQEIEGQLVRESQYMKAQLRRMKKAHAERIEALEQRFNAFEEEIARLKKERQNRSDQLQRWIFAQFRMRNARGEEADLNEIFRRYAVDKNSFSSVPPSGSGECCAPKLLQFAYLHGLKPVCMAEFWWGRSPVGEIRHHGKFYPSCRGKCLPILTFMLQGLEVDPDPLEGKTDCAGSCSCHNCRAGGLELIYEDETIAVVNKPAEMLSVPGKSGETSVYSIVREMFPQAEEPMMVHRLDMDTSGLMVISKSKQAHENLQRQFAEHSIRKTYIALVRTGSSTDEDTGKRIPLRVGESGTIDLPLIPDYLDRPRQKVDFGCGKPAVTEYRVLEVYGCSGNEAEIVTDDGYSQTARLELKPLTGRTHQLRVHCAHPEGLASPILGDPLYGIEMSRPVKSPAVNNSLHMKNCEAQSIAPENPARMYLHAATLELTHPITCKRLTFHADPEF